MKTHFQPDKDIFTVCGRLASSLKSVTNMKWMVTCKRCKVSVVKEMKEDMTPKFTEPKRVGEP